MVEFRCTLCSCLEEGEQEAGVGQEQESGVGVGAGARGGYMNCRVTGNGHGRFELMKGGRRNEN